MKQIIIFILAIIILQYANCQVLQISQLGLGDRYNLFSKCQSYSSCDHSLSCQVELDRCGQCGRNSYKQYKKLSQKNKAKYECYKECIYSSYRHKDGNLQREVFDFLLCLKSNIYSMQEFQTQKTAYVIKIHHLVQNAFKKYPNWKLVQNPQYSDWDLKWDFYHNRLNYNKSKKLQLGNKIQNLQDVMGDKVSFLNLLRDYDKKNLFKMKSSDFIPETYVINLKDQQNSEEYKKLIQTQKKYWIVKAPAGYGGDGIIILETLKEVQDYVSQQKNKSKKINQKNQDHNLIVQKYIENPMLIDKRKFDIRSFVLVASTDPFLILYHEGYFRQTLENFDMEIKPYNLKVQLKHLTNSSMQQKGSKWNSQNHKHGKTYWQSFKDIQKDYDLNDHDVKEIDLEMQHILGYTFGASLDKLKRYPGSFHLTGMDFMMDDDLNVVFLEANQNPRIQEKFPGEAEQCPHIAQSVIDLELQILSLEDKYERTEVIKNIQDYIDLRGWKVLINEASNYNILNDQKYSDHVQKQEQQQNNKKIHNTHHDDL